MINPKNKYKIALVAYTLNKGGLEKAMANLSFCFDIKNIEVHLLILSNQVTYAHAGIIKTFGYKNKMYRYYKLYKYLRKINFDYIIDFRYRLNPIMEFLFAKIIYNKPFIYTVHSAKVSTYLLPNKFLSSLIFNNNYGIVCVAKAIEKQINQTHVLKNVTTIYNPIPLQKIAIQAQERIAIDFKYIITAGRFESQDIKQFGQLIETYLHSKLPKLGIHLVLIGDGPTKDKMQSKYKAFNKVHFLGFKDNPYPYMRNAEFYVLSSQYEGFGMVLVEALATAIPVISFDCKTGPNEIIIHNHNGILVKNQDFKQLKLAMETLATDTILYNKCKNNAIPTVKKFDTVTIGKQWLELMNINLP